MNTYNPREQDWGSLPYTVGTEEDSSCENWETIPVNLLISKYFSTNFIWFKILRNNLLNYNSHFKQINFALDLTKY